VKVVICDDHRLLAEALAHRLRSRGHEVAVVLSPSDAHAQMQIAAKHGRPFTLCLMDLRFPDDSHAGLHALPGLRVASPETVLMLLSSALDERTAHDALAAGAHVVARKDISLAALETAVADAEDGHALAPFELVRTGKAGHLTPREREVLALVARGMSTVEIGTSLGLAASTVRGHVEAVLTKLDVTSRLHAVAMAGSTITEAHSGVLDAS
jgi:two-component system nitrate/nitrite response regulator NarL